MKSRLLIAAMILIIAAGGSFAQLYQIRVANNTNLRASYSLDSAVLASAPAGTTLEVYGKQNRWLNVNLDGRSYWMADWVGYTRVEPTAPTQVQSAANVDNCCFVDRQCQTDQDWVDGWWAYQNGHCVAPARSQSQTSEQPTGNASSQIDNCCFAGWQCNTDQEWVNGYRAYQENRCQLGNQVQPGGGDNCCLTGWNCADEWDWNNGRWAFANNACVHPAPHNTRPGEGPSCCFHGWNCTFDFDWLAGRFHYRDYGGQCGSPIQEIFEGVILEGSPTFIARVKEALSLIKRRSPEWYAYTITATRKIREKPSGASSPLQHSINLSNGHVRGNPANTASVIVHESCHQQRWLVWVWRDFETEWLAEEAVCDTVASNAMRQISPGRRAYRGRVNAFHALGIPFDVDASANREWERAKLILSRMS